MQQLHADKRKREQGITKTVRGKYRTGTSNAPIADKQGSPLITETEKKVDGQIISAGTLEAGADLNINAEPVTKEEIGNVITAIESLKKRKAHGHDNNSNI